MIQRLFSVAGGRSDRKPHHELLKNVTRVKISSKRTSDYLFMSQSQPSEQELLKSLLEPLLEDFQYWFSRSRTLLETEDIPFLSEREQADLLSRVKNAQQEVSTAQMLFRATGRQVGIETSTLIPWHRLVSECWQVGMQWRTLTANSPTSDIQHEDRQV